MYMEIVEISCFLLVVCGSFTWTADMEYNKVQAFERDIYKRTLKDRQKNGTTEMEKKQPTKEKEKDLSWLKFTGRMIKKRQTPIDTRKFEARERKTAYRKRRGTADDFAEEEIDDDPNGGYGPWLTWGSCSVSCGRGRSERRRICRDPTHCRSGDMEIRICGLVDCPFE